MIELEEIDLDDDREIIELQHRNTTAAMVRAS